MKIGLLGAAVLVLHAVAPSTTEAEAPSIRGTVLFADGSVPTLAHVTVGCATAFKIVETDANGNYEISDLPAGTYDLTVFGVLLSDRAGRYTRTKVEIKAHPAPPSIVNIVLDESAPPNLPDAGDGGKQVAPDP